MIEQHRHILEQYWQQHSREYTYKYPDMFDPKWTITESGWPWFRLSSLDDQPWKEMHAEAEALLEYFKPHREDYGHGWQSLTLHGLNDDTQSLNQYSDNRQETLNQLDWTWVADRCPTTKKFLTDVWPAEYLNRVRFMLLEPGGYILPHQDRPSDQKRLSVCNISLNMPDGCEMLMKDQGRIPFDDNGSAMLVDISNEHAVWNRSNKPRIHMIIHYELGRRLRDFFYVLRSSYYTNREQ
tara:strand:+ start:6256 stop:6972 length:717 start_codon:yes stop_codon:yes gene_type:complete